MNDPGFDKPQLLALIAEVLAGRLDEADSASLSEILKASSAARRFYHEHMELHARLHLEYTESAGAAHMPGTAVKHPVSRISPSHLALAAIAACLALLAVIAWPRHAAEAAPFATLVENRNARWDAGDLPTAEGSRLGKGTLRLAEGLVKIRFDSGAELVLEAPTTLTLTDRMHCTLLNGMVVAEMPVSAKGFRIETPTTHVIDYGTRFSVIAEAENGRTHTRVFEGLVKVENRSSGERATLKQGQSNTSGADGLLIAQTATDDEVWQIPIGPPMRDPQWTFLETTKDAYIGKTHARGRETHDSETLLLLKNGSVHRKSYLGFDLSGIAAENLKDAELILHFEPTGWGMTSLVPDATFHVYGLLTNETWDEKTISLRNAPANTWRSHRPANGTVSATQLETGKVRKLGTFEIMQGVQRGQFGIQGEPLAAFLRDRAGAEITLIIARETREKESNGLVHGFASRRHPMLRPPTLAIRLEAP